MNYKQVYKNFFGYLDDEYIPCEVCTLPATDIHHIVLRSQKKDDSIENLIGLCRSCHNRAHFKSHPYLVAEYLQEKHDLFIKRNIDNKNAIDNY